MRRARVKSRVRTRSGATTARSARALSGDSRSHLTPRSANSRIGGGVGSGVAMAVLGPDVTEVLTGYVWSDRLGTHYGLSKLSVYGVVSLSFGSERLRRPTRLRPVGRDRFS